MILYSRHLRRSLIRCLDASVSVRAACRDNALIFGWLKNVQEQCTWNTNFRRDPDTGLIII